MPTYKISPYIKKNIEFLEELANARSQKKRKTLVLSANTDQILAVIEVCSNVLKHNFPLSSEQRRRIGKYGDFYKSLARSRTEETARKRLQEGSGIALGAILIPVLSALAELAVKKIIE